GAASTWETNAQRLARGLPPKAPLKRFSASERRARRASPSGTPSQCTTGAIQCCNSLTLASNPVASLISGLLGIVVGGDVMVGLTCSPLSVVGVGGNSCSSSPVCCENNSFNGLIALNCVPSMPCTSFEDVY
ncbi:hydrophobin-domain-containing protein, partial [Hymenopellis radicata]